MRLRGGVDKATEKLALRAALTAAHLVGVATGVLLRRLRGMNDPLAEALARVKEAELKATCFCRAAELVGARFDKLPERKRPFYSPPQRFQILEIKNLLGWAADYTARVFRVCTSTILNWKLHADPTSKTVGSTVKPTPPVTRRADVVRNTVRLMAGYNFGDDEAIALGITRAGWDVSERTVGRVMKERPYLPPPPPSHNPGLKATHPVVARFVRHVWMMDVTAIASFLGPDLYLAAVFDAFSRAPLVVETFDTKPGAPAMARLLKAAVRTFGKATYVITDQGGGEFTGRIFQKTAARLGIVQRFCSADNNHATARLERFWRTLKQLARLKADRPLTIQDLERRLETTLTYFLCFRPHRKLHGATPAEAFLGLKPASKNACSATITFAGRQE